jgi:hypothetical protein
VLNTPKIKDNIVICENVLAYNRAVAAGKTSTAEINIIPTNFIDTTIATAKIIESKFSLHLRLILSAIASSLSNVKYANLPQKKFINSIVIIVNTKDINMSKLEIASIEPNKYE